MFRSVVLLLVVSIFIVGVSSVTLVAADGKALYEGKCLSCHGPDAKGKQKIADMYKIDISKLNLVDSKASDTELMKDIRDGVGDGKKMKSFKDKLSDDDISAIIKYLHSLKK